MGSLNIAITKTFFLNRYRDPPFGPFVHLLLGLSMPVLNSSWDLLAFNHGTQHALLEFADTTCWHGQMLLDWLCLSCLNEKPTNANKMVKTDTDQF